MASTEEASWLVSNGIKTSEDLVRTLKGSSAAFDKVKVASEAWTDAGFNVARKEQLLLDWAMDVLSNESRASKSAAGTKGKGREQEHLTLRADFWTLLYRVASAVDEAVLASTSARTHPLQAISRTIDSIASVEASSTTVLIEAASRALSVVIAGQRSGQVSIDGCHDIMLALCNAVIACTSTSEKTEVSGRREAWVQGLSRLLLPLMDVWLGLLERGANAKKSYRFFLDKMLEAYAQALYRLDALPLPAHTALRTALGRLPSACLFRSNQLPQVDQIDALKRHTEEIFSKIRETPVADRTAVAHLLPILLTHLHSRVSQLSRAASSVAPSTSRSTLAPSRHVSDQLTRQAIFYAFLEPAFALLRQLEANEESSLELKEESLRVRIQLLKVVEAKQLYASADIFADQLFELFKDSAQAAQGALEIKRLSDLSMELLLLIRRLDEIAVEDAISDVALKIATTTNPSDEQSAVTREMLAMMCSKATRSREVPDFVNVLLAAVQAAIKQQRLSSIEALQSCTFSPWFFENHLAPALAQFVVPEQTVPLVDSLRVALLPHVQAATEAAATTLKEGSDRKRRRTSEAKRKANENNVVSTESAQAIVLMNLAAEVMKSLALAQPVLTQASSAAKRLYNEVALACMDIGIENPSSHDSGPLAAAALELRASLANRQWKSSQDDGTMDMDDAGADNGAQDLSAWMDASLDERFDAFEGLLSDDSTHAELRIMTHNTLLQRIDRDTRRGKTESPYARLLDNDHFGLMTSSMPHRKAIEPPSFGVHGCQKDAEVPLLWTYVAWRWLPLLDQLASQKLLEGMAAVAVDIIAGHHETGSLLDIVGRTLTKDGSNLELGRWREAVLSCLEESLVNKEVASGVDRSSVHSVLLKLPLPYLSMTTRTKFATAALDIDRELRSSRLTEAAEANWAAIRWWFASFLAHPSSELKDLVIELEDLMSFATASGEHGDDLTKASSHLFDVTISSLVSSIRRKERASERIALLARVMDRTRRESNYGDAHQLILHAALTLAESNAEAADVILANVTKQERWLLPQLDRSNLAATIRQVRRLRSNIRAEQLSKKSLGSQDRDEDGSSSLAEGAIELLLSVVEDVNGGSFDADANKMCVELLDLLREVQGTHALIRAADAFPIYLEAALSSSTAVDVYAATSLFVDLASSSPIQVYDAALSNLVGTLVADSEEDGKRKKGSLQTCSLLLCNGPEGTLTMAQRHFGTFISAVTSIIVASMRRSDLDVVYHSIRSVEAIVAGRILLLRFQDMADLLVLMSCLCSSSFTSSDAEVVGQVGHTSSGQAVARSIISTLSTTVRLRQDLVSRLVAQLTTVLVQLVGLFRSLRVAVSATGGRAPLQIRAAQRQVPTWLDLEKEPLGIEEARLFARLLATITTRSTTASALSLPKKKADNKALSRAFSNHAAYVLIAYVRTLVGGGDSATTISSEVRTELLLGLMGLCDIVGEHQRDAAMMLLEQGERLLFKNVWNEWEKKRYKGV